MDTKKHEIQVSMTDSILLMTIIIVEIVACVRGGLNLAVPLFLTWIIVYIYCLIRKYEWSKVEGYALQSVRDGFQSVVIVGAVGCLIGAWILCGTVPTLIYFGLQIVSPSIFLPATLILCTILSLATGTSYGSAASAGLACMGIGLSMGFPAGVIAGAVICGALFGDKMSPFSDTTNLAPAMANGTLYGHIKSMCYNTIPAWIITLILFGIIGSRYSIGTYDPSTINAYMNGLAANFHIGLLPLLPMLLVILMLIKRTPALPTILLGGVFGGLVAMVGEGATFIQVVKVMHKGFSIKSGIFLVDRLLNRGGITSMYDIMMIMIFAMGLGGMLERMGVLDNFIGLFIKKVHSLASLVFATMCTSYLSGAIGCTMSMAHVITGKLFAPIYREKGVSPDVLSRTMEDCGTLGGTLMPWHTNAVFFTGTLGVAYMDYIPYVFLCYLAPLISLLFAFIGFAVWFVDPVTGKPIAAKDAPINQK